MASEVDYSKLLTTAQAAGMLDLRPENLNQLCNRTRGINPDLKHGGRWYFTRKTVDRIRETEEYKSARKYSEYRKERDKNAPGKLPHQQSKLCVNCYHVSWRLGKAFCRKTRLEIEGLKHRSQKCGCWKFENKDTRQIEQTLPTSYESEE